MESVSTRQTMVVSVATLSMMIRIALVVFISGVATKAEAWTVDDGINYDADNAQQEQPDRGFCHRFDFNLLFAAQLDQPFFQTFAVNRVVRKFRVKQHCDQKDITSTASRVDGITTDNR